MSAADFSITLRLRHPHIDPTELTNHLGIEPQHSWRAGEPRRLETGELDRGVYRETYWVGLLQAAPDIDEWSVRLDPRPAGTPAIGEVAPQTALFFTLLKMKRASAFWRTFTAQGGSIHCLLQVHRPERFQLDFPPALFAIFVDLKIGLSIEVDSSQRAVAA